MSMQSVPRRARLSSHASWIHRRDRPPSWGFFVNTLATLVARIQFRRFALIAAPTMRSDAPLL